MPDFFFHVSKPISELLVRPANLADVITRMKAPKANAWVETQFVNGFLYTECFSEKKPCESCYEIKVFFKYCFYKRDFFFIQWKTRLESEPK